MVLGLMNDNLTLKTLDIMYRTGYMCNHYYITATIIIKKVLTVRRLDEERVLTQYLFQSISRSFLSSDDLK